ncbi:protein adenylyltransferase SelO [Salibaculum griseiflavum]|uniref:Protein nucleotidyltransferase YdiU n=1 Tax=Salibaculum griseiflavum TaxID=1914409 RepID=A0A2V1P6X9_9RHOB|nr:YdiU family protein [Salibaculum griseiflavum]PWG18249.1 YdiU family protein [Salibaculum griseiflavum]
MTLSIPFDNSYATLPDRFYTRQGAAPVREPRLFAFNDALARTLGLEGFDDPAELAEIFAGNTLPEGAAPLAQLYAGHQFGGFSPQLGDGRALLLGEVATGTGRFDIQLKGSGPTPYSRMGDGRAWVGPVIREYLMSEAMAAIGVPTTRALAAVTTGEPVLREDGPLPGAILTRVAASHIRVGTFQVFAARADRDALQQLTDYTIARHFPRAGGPMGLLHALMEVQADLVAHWMSIGFIHGVMNTDNMAISGETIDYGPCAFMDAYHPNTVFSSIDRQGRYAYSNQPPIAHWNIAQFASALVPIMGDEDKAVDDLTEAIKAFPPLYEAAWLRHFGAKFGLAEATPDDRPLIEEFLTHMAQEGLDFTNTFAALPDVPAGLQDWARRWQARGPDMDLVARSNPRVIPRLHRIEAVIQSAVADDFAPFDEMLSVVTDPFAPADPLYTAPPAPEERVSRTFCGT